MRYILKELIPGTGRVYRDNKSRRDIADILRSMGFGVIAAYGDPSVRPGAYRKMRSHFERLREGDSLFVQTPLMTSPAILRKLFRSLAKRGVRIYMVIHDLEAALEDNAALIVECDGVFVNNERTALEIIKRKLDVQKMVPMELLDYLIPDSVSGSCGEYSRKGPVVFAGKLSRAEAGFLYRLPDNYSFRVYGTGFESGAGGNVEFGGEYTPEDLPFMLTGSFGLIWDGPSPMTCLGIAGQRMKTSNPEQFSLFLASGMPVIVWSESAIADFVVQRGCGFTVSSLAEIGYRINAMSEKTYHKMRKSAEDAGIPMRDGCYTRRAIIKMCGE